jgi:hypothetical protein
MLEGEDMEEHRAKEKALEEGRAREKALKERRVRERAIEGREGGSEPEAREEHES